MWWKAQQPDLVTGPPSWQWLARAFGSTTALAADPRLARLEIPLLMLVADADKMVDPRVARRVAARLPDCTRSEERRVGQECVRTGRYRGWQIYEKKTTTIHNYLNINSNTTHTIMIRPS